MERGKYRTVFASLAGGLWMLLSCRFIFCCRGSGAAGGCRTAKS